MLAVSRRGALHELGTLTAAKRPGISEKRYSDTNLSDTHIFITPCNRIMNFEDNNFYNWQNYCNFET